MISKALVVGAYHKKAEEIAKRGVDLHVVIPRRWGDREPEIRDGTGYSMHLLPCLLSGHNHFHFYLRLAQCVQSVNPDLIHIDEESYSLVTFQAMRIARQHSVPAVFFNWQNILKKHPFPFSWFERYQFRNAIAGIAGSEEVQRVLRQKGCSLPLPVIPQFGVDPEIFTKRNEAALRQELFGGGNVQVVGYAGRLVEEKGLLALVDVLARLPDSSRLLLVGGGPLKDDIRQRASALRLEKRIVILEHVPSMDVPRYLNCMDCLVLNSQTRKNWKEQFGRILIEAMACEVPVVGSDSGEIPAVIGEAGIVVPENNVELLGHALRQLLNDPSRLSRLGMLGRERVLEHFTQARIAEKTVAVYRTFARSPA